MSYTRKIAYLDYMEYGEKKGSRGFCKWEQKKDIHKMEIFVSGLEMPKLEALQIVTRSSIELGKMAVNKGRAAVVFLKEKDEGNWEWEFSQIRIRLDEDRELFAEFEAEPLKMVMEDKVEARHPETFMENAPEEILITIPVEANEENEYMFSVEKEGKYEEVEPEKKAMIVEPEEITADEPPLHSLWECLIKEHKIMRPFGTKAEYCRIVLADIFLLEGRFHILKNNPFLLHGYYNYKYLILGRKDEWSEEYWLGVPGIYHEREKVAAKMYGFEKFEGAKPKYGIGDLGYYLITVR